MCEAASEKREDQIVENWFGSEELSGSTQDQRGILAEGDLDVHSESLPEGSWLEFRPTSLTHLERLRHAKVRSAHARRDRDAVSGALSGDTRKKRRCEID
jgi:hypothetical protein